MCNHYKGLKDDLERLRAMKWFEGEAAIAALNDEGDVVSPDDLASHKWPKSQAPILVQTAECVTVESARWGVAMQIRGASGKMLSKHVTNARDDKLSSWTWRRLVAERRCLVPTSAYFEPDGPPGAKWEVRFSMSDRRPFLLAGLWDFDPEGLTRSFTIVTTGPNELAARIHDRMPLVLDAPAACEWLGFASLEPERLAALCQPYPADRMLSEALPAPSRPSGRPTCLPRVGR